MKSKLKNPHITKLRPDGSLSIYFGLKNYHAIKILPWEEGCHILVRRDQGWEYYDGSLDIVLVNIAHEGLRDSVLTRFGKSIPEEFKFKVSKYRTHQARLLQLIASIPAARDLFDCNPVLLWMLVHWSYSNEKNMVQLKDALSMKQVGILKLIIPNTSQKHIKLIKNFDLSTYGKETISLVHKMISLLDSVPQLGHCQTISPAICDIFTRLNVLDSEEYKLIVVLLKYYQSGGNDSLHDILLRYRDIFTMQAELYGEGTQPNFTQRSYTITDMDIYHDKLMVEYNALADLRQSFPEPFVKGNNDIVHITNNMDLLAEGRDMKHCVASYRSRILRRDSCIYKVLHPQRATLELVHRNGQYYINQVKLKSNGTPSKFTFSHIKRWLKGSRKR